MQSYGLAVCNLCIFYYGQHITSFLWHVYICPLPLNILSFIIKPNLLGMMVLMIYQDLSSVLSAVDGGCLTKIPFKHKLFCQQTNTTYYITSRARLTSPNGKLALPAQDCVLQDSKTL